MGVDMEVKQGRGYSEVSGPMDQVPGYDPDRREHLWVVGLIFRVLPTDGHEYVLDHENLIHATSLRCFHCEELYTPERAGEPCPGDPEV